MRIRLYRKTMLGFHWARGMDWKTRILKPDLGKTKQTRLSRGEFANAQRYRPENQAFFLKALRTTTRASFRQSRRANPKAPHVARRKRFEISSHRVFDGFICRAHFLADTRHLFGRERFRRFQTHIRTKECHIVVFLQFPHLGFVHRNASLLYEPAIRTIERNR